MAYHEMSGLAQHELDAKFFTNGAIMSLTELVHRTEGHLPEKTREILDIFLDELRALEAQLKAQNPQRDAELITYKVLRATRIMESLQALDVEQLPAERERYIKEIEQELTVN